MYIYLFVVAVAWMITGIAWGAASPVPLKSVAFYYGANPPINSLKAFDAVVIQPDIGLTPATYGVGTSQLYSYVSVGEVSPDQNYASLIRSSWVIGENTAWNTKVMDVSNSDWREFLFEKVIDPLWNLGFRGFFLDTLDSYQLATTVKNYPKMQAGLVSLIQEIHQKYPGVRLIDNRGFEFFPQVKGYVSAVAAESLFQTFNPTTGKYGVVSASDRLWLTNQLNIVKKAGVPAVAIEYVQPGNKTLETETATRVKALGFIPYVTDKDLITLGID